MRKDLSILVVDDEPIIRGAMKQLLEHCGCEVEAFDNGVAALARLAQRQFDVVITDFSMPGMQGDQLVARIRKVAPHQRIVMATAYVEEYKVFGDPFSSVNGLLFKPFTLKELQDAIEEVMAQEMPGGLQAMPAATDTMPPEPPKLFPPSKA